ncbi:MAG TPA: glycosyltransferase family 2 protein, partial [Candidatus Eisenbacteria bacterium]|nr:glycosyltransferase family 2 protein [Candidatus Eisenbacteria bacterium]
MTPAELTVVIPSHDGLPEVVDAVESALAQSVPPAAVVVVDDDSHDGTTQALRSRFGERVTLVQGKFGSAGAARNAGWRAARTAWIGFLDADDLWFPDKLAVAARQLAASPAAGWFFSDGAFRTLAGELQPSWLATWAELREPYLGRPVAELIEVNFILTSSVVVRRDLLERLGGFDASLTHAEDVDLWIRLARTAPATASARALVRYQHRPGGLTRDRERRLEGDIVVFGRLAADAALPRALRARARRRCAVASYKLAIACLREDRPRDARRELRRAWLF